MVTRDIDKDILINRKWITDAYINIHLYKYIYTLIYWYIYMYRGIYKVIVMIQILIYSSVKHFLLKVKQCEPALSLWYFWDHWKYPEAEQTKMRKHEKEATVSADSFWTQQRVLTSMTPPVYPQTQGILFCSYFQFFLFPSTNGLNYEEGKSSQNLWPLIYPLEGRH